MIREGAGRVPQKINEVEMCSLQTGFPNVSSFLLSSEGSVDPCTKPEKIKYLLYMRFVPDTM